MSLGLGIFLSSVLLGTVWLFVVTKDRWNWKKLSLWPVAIVVLLSGAVGAIYLYSLMPKVEKSFWDIPINAGKNDVKFIKGEPSEEETDRWIYFDTDEEGNVAAYYVYFADDKVWAVSYWSTKIFDWMSEKIQGIRIGTHIDRVVEKFGKPSNVSVSDDGLKRIYAYGDYNVLFELEKSKVTTLGVYNPEIAKRGVKFRTSK